MEPLAALFTDWGQGVAIEEPIFIADDGESALPALGPLVCVKTYLRADRFSPGRLRRLERSVWHLAQLRAIQPLKVVRLLDTDWETAWKQHYSVQPIGQRLIVAPSWLPRPGREGRRPEGRIPIRLDPGMAFGTGLHPSTRLCLEALEEFVLPGHRVLDVGTGSGILAIAGAKLGAARVLALDTDALAVKVATENVRRNRVKGKVDVRFGSLPLEGEGEFDLCVANINLRTHLQLHEQIGRALCLGGMAVFSGVLAERWTELMQALTIAGWEIGDALRQADWVAAVARKAPCAPPGETPR